MQQIFINSNQINDNRIIVEGQDAKHLIRVCRIKPSEVLRVSTDTGMNYLCHVEEVNEECLIIIIDEETVNTELPNKIYLFQAIPKGDRMETIIEKCTELGVYEIIPVEMKYCVVKLDDKKKKKRLERYKAIAEAAAKQSKRSRVPDIHEVMTYKEAIEYARKCDINLVPYENKEGMKATRDAFDNIESNKSISIIVGPEGGFATEEIQAVEDMQIISLGQRILRTDTAAILSVGLVMSHIECGKE